MFHFYTLGKHVFRGYKSGTLVEIELTKVNRKLFRLSLLSFFRVIPFVPNAPFLYPLKTSEKLTVF